MIKTLFLSSLLILGLGDLRLRQAHAQSKWKPIDTLKSKPLPVIWETTISDSAKLKQTPTKWEVVPEPKDENQPSSTVVWEVLQNKDDAFIPPSKKKSESTLIPPRNLEQAEAILDIIPLQSSDFKPLLNISHTVPTASVLSQDEWRLISSTISPFKYASGTGNQNYAIQLDYGLSDTLQISGFYSEADDPLNAQIKGLDVQGSLWKVFGAAARGRLLKQIYHWH